MDDKFALQAQQYQFPYHYLVDLREQTFGKSLGWGLDYLTYMRKVAVLAEQYLGEDMLDVGCGDGVLLHHLARTGVLGENARAVGIDIDEKPVKFAQAFAHDYPNVSFEAADIADCDGDFSLVTAVETFEHIPDDLIAAFAAHVERLVRPGGHLIVSVPSTARPVLEKHHRHYTAQMLRDHFPACVLREEHHVTDRSHPVYHLVSALLCQRHFSLSGSALGDVLLRLHERFSSTAAPGHGAHVVVVFHKPAEDA